MGITKTNIYSQEQNQLASFAKVLGHPARIAILQHLLSHKTCICGDLVDQIGLAQATISQHLKEMKAIGLIVGSIDGPKVCYCINKETYTHIKKMFDTILNEALIDNQKCC